MAYKIITVGIIVAVSLIGLLTLANGYQQVDAGHRGILLTFGAVDDDKAYAEGAHIVMPLVQEIVQMSIQVQKYESTADSASKDLQTVTTQITVNYHPDPEKVQVIFKELGTSYESRIIDPAVEEVVKQVSANYNAEELITKRPEVKSLITTEITKRLLEYNIIVREISITDFKFSVGFSQAIEDKVTVEQKAKKAELLVKQIEFEALQVKAEAEGIAFKKIEEARGEKQAAILNAEGQAEAILIVAQANADRIELLANAVRANPDLLTLEFIQQWNGKFPDTYLSSNGEELSMLLGIPNIQTP